MAKHDVVVSMVPVNASSAAAPDTAATENPNSELDEEVARATKSAADKATAVEDPVMVFVETVENVEEM
jgi:hypothetical protein